jgi:hypothetical protein
VMDDVLFNQWGILAGATRIDCTTLYRGDATDFAPIMEQENGIRAYFLLRRRSFCPRLAPNSADTRQIRAISIVNSIAASVN